MGLHLGISGSLTNRLTGTTATTTAAGLDAVLLQIGQVGVTGAGVQVHGAVAVVLGSLVFVAHHHANRSSQGNSKLRSGLDFNAVLLITRRRQSTLTGTSAGHLGLDVVLGEFHSWGAAVDDAADRAAVRFTITEKRNNAISMWAYMNRGVYVCVVVMVCDVTIIIDWG